MVRKRLEDQTETPEAALTHISTEHISTDVLVNPAPLIGSVVETSGEEVPDVRIRRFRITQGGLVAMRTGVVTLRPGKVIREIDYDLPRLIEQGVQMVEVQ